MDINQSSFSRLKSNKTGLERPKSGTASISDPAKLKETSRTGTSQTVQNASNAQWKEGQIIKGEIIDLRYNEVSIKLEPGKQVITAKLEGDLPLSIGQSAQFQVTEDSSDRLTLKYLPPDTKATTDVTVEKALTASNLALTERNKAIVEELLSHRMSIDRQTLQEIVKLSHNNREASSLTLVLMKKYQIPVTAENVSQFEACQKGTNQILNDIHHVIKSISDMIQKTNLLQPQEAIDLNSKLLNLISDSISKDSDLPLPLLSDLLSDEDRALLGNTLLQKLSMEDAIPADLKADLINKIAKGTISPGEVGNLMQQFITADTTNNKAEQIMNHLLEKHMDPQAPYHDSANNSAASTIRNPYAQNTIDSTELSNTDFLLKSVLTSKERENLCELLKTFPGINNKAAQLAEGTATVNDALNMIKDGLSGQTEEAVKNILSSSAYIKLIEEAFHQKWTITPEKLSWKNPVNRLYQNIQSDLSELCELLKTDNKAEVSISFQEPAKNLQDNLGFLKDLNQMFTYLPLPVQFRDKDVSSDLYVFTKKDALKDPKKSLNVLLHLDMQNLGPMNIHILMDHNQIQAKFYLDDTAAGNLVSEHLQDLTNLLQKKGYSFHAQVERTYVNPDFSRDFIEQSSEDNDIRRYTFDIRT